MITSKNGGGAEEKSLPFVQGGCSYFPLYIYSGASAYYESVGPTHRMGKKGYECAAEWGYTSLWDAIPSAADCHRPRPDNGGISLRLTVSARCLVLSDG